MKPRFSILTLLGAMAITPWLVVLWGDFGWYALMVVTAIVACFPRSLASYFARGMLFGCVVYQVVIGTEADNVLSALVRRFIYSREFSRESGLWEYDIKERRLMLVVHILQLASGAAFGFLALWRYRRLERRDSIPPQKQIQTAPPPT